VVGAQAARTSARTTRMDSTKNDFLLSILLFLILISFLYCLSNL
jgi:nitrate reductase gamma subunit